MSVYAEWFWSCDECDEVCEEPWGDQGGAEDDLIEHKFDAHRSTEL